MGARSTSSNSGFSYGTTGFILEVFLRRIINIQIVMVVNKIIMEITMALEDGSKAKELK